MFLATVYGLRHVEALNVSFATFGVDVRSSSAFPAVSLGFTILCEIFTYATVSCCLFFSLFFFKSNHRISHMPSSWMMHAGCVFVAGIRRART